CIVKSVLNAYRNNEHHSLKAELDVVLQQKFPNAKPVKEIIIVREKPAMATDEQYQEFVEAARAFTGAMKFLATLARINATTASLIANRGFMRVHEYQQFQPHFASVFAEQARHLQPKPKAVPKPRVKKPKNNNGQKVMRQIMGASVAEARNRKGVA
ncbi:hypothetical protein F954_02860, partial [Acinetobacter brisouii ANC 4119]